MSTIKTNQLAHTANGASVFTLPTADGSANQFLKTNGSGQLAFASLAAGGKIGQVVTDIYEETAADRTTTSSVYADTNLELDITPAASGSKILVIAFVNGSRVSNSGTNCVYNIQRTVGSNSDYLSGQIMGLAHTYSNNAVSLSMGMIDTQDNYGSTVNYKVRFRNYGNGAYVATGVRLNTTNFFLAAEILA
tara:strand:+ start:3472 stop:4047 length:576 start_codon:yes stop_codon:yes gene_type:complete